ncbi:hypothetical protein B0O80DRAFT_422396 [Mortierella sp. GBAus27b]|nr:hypothetical protein B0O80DRAFT_422396 [Mortierella sp. GBAus27b]
MTHRRYKNGSFTKEDIIKKPTGRHVLLLGFVALLVASHVNAEIPDGSRTHTPVDRHKYLWSGEIPSERRTLIKIPVVNGVATPIKTSAASSLEPSQEEGAGQGGDGTVRYEMDHQVPSHEDLRSLYPNHGRSLTNDPSTAGAEDDDESTRQSDPHFNEAAKADDPSQSAQEDVEQTEGDEDLQLTRAQNQNQSTAKELDRATMGQQYEDPQSPSSDKPSPQSMSSVPPSDQEAEQDIAPQESEVSLNQGTDVMGSTEQPEVSDIGPDSTPTAGIKVKDDGLSLDGEDRGALEPVVPQDAMSEDAASPGEQKSRKQDDVSRTPFETKKDDEAAAHDLESTQQEVDSDSDDDETLLEDFAAQLLNQYLSEALTEAHKAKSHQQTDANVQREARVNSKLNKNHENFDKQEDIVNFNEVNPIDVKDTAGMEENKRTDAAASLPRSKSATGSHSDQTETTVVSNLRHRHHHHHHHRHHSSPNQAPNLPLQHGQQQSQQQEPVITDDVMVEMEGDQSQQVKAVHSTSNVGSQKVLISGDQGETADTQANTDTKDSNTKDEMPDSLRSRGLIPSVIGAHHCTPQFCVNVSLSDDAKFATFHIERPLAETGWISLGIGYAMTLADLLILWPNPSSQNGGGPRGATLSRRTSHAYVEPHLVGTARGAHARDGPSEGDLYPPDEYVLHNANPEASISGVKVFPDNSKFIVQFTRPVKIKNAEYKLTPGQEQDFCWAYSPKPISPDSVADPGAHITQHLSVGTFAMDVGANQPHLKDAILKQKADDERLDKAEKERKKKEQDENHSKLQGDATGPESNEEQVVSHHSPKPSEAVSWLFGLRQSGHGLLMLGPQWFSCLLTIALVLFFR